MCCVCMPACMHISTKDVYVVTCTAFPHVTLHSQPFPFTRLVAVLCLTRVTCPA